jgi:hypothetical protein
MVDARIYPGHKLSKDETDQRRRLIHAEHTKFHNEWAAGNGQQHFDVGRFSSPMWQKYREYFKDDIKKGFKQKRKRDKAAKPVKVPWTSKWQNPADFKMTKEKFLHLDELDDEDPDFEAEPAAHYLDNNPEKTITPASVVPGIRGTDNYFSWRLIKEFAAKVKHKQKYAYLTDKQRNFVVITQNLTAAAQNGHIPDMARAWKQHSKGKKPWDYDRVFLLGVVWYKQDKAHPMEITGGHAFLVVIHMSKYNNLNFHLWDSGWGTWSAEYHAFEESLRAWIKHEGWTGQIGFKIHTGDLPRQKDPAFCGQFMIHAAREMMAHPDKMPDWTGWKVPLWEPNYDIIRHDKKYEYGAKSPQGNLYHPELDTMVKHVSDIKVKDHARMKKWEDGKVFRGFK